MTRKIICVIIFVLLLFGTHIVAQAAVTQKVSTVKTDSSEVVARAFDQTALSAYKAQNDFQYGTGYQTDQSIWSRFWRWFWNYFNNVVSGAASNNVARNISLVLLVSLTIFLIIKFSGVGLHQLFSGKARAVPIPHTESQENIHEINFEEEIGKAIRHLDYRLAVRMLYLKSLKKLSDSGLIAWQIDKTNSAYIAELHNPVKKEKFAFLTRQFEYIWYGQFNIQQAVFHEIHEEFKNFNKSL